MKANKLRYSVYFVIAAVLAGVSLSPAGQTASTITLKPTDEHPEATGVAVIADDQIQIEAHGLKPDSVYTAWFVNTKPGKKVAGAGQSPYMFKTDAAGNGRYASRLNESPYGKWQMIMIVLHPNDDPRDMGNMVGALTADLS